MAGNQVTSRVLGWTTTAQLVLHVRHGSRLLMVGYLPVPGEIAWRGTALEMSDDPDEVLDDHRHELLPKVRSVTDAIDQGEKYAKRWQKRRATEDRCKCGPIASGARGAKAS